MSLIIGLLSGLLFLDSLLLILLVLIQLPKKDAGGGVAFGGGATDTLFGAGPSNALVTITKYCATIFLGLSLVVSMLNARETTHENKSFEKELEKRTEAAKESTVLQSQTNQTATKLSPTINLTSATNNALTGAAQASNAVPAKPIVSLTVPTNVPAAKTSKPTAVPVTNAPAPAKSQPATSPESTSKTNSAESQPAK